MEFPELNDPRTGESLMKRTVLIANTSDMPVAAREASIYTGITIAEYFRDMGYKVAIMADSTSRWAEALREMSGRLEEMPGEEGYPAYLCQPPGRVLMSVRASSSALGAKSAPARSQPSARYPLRAAISPEPVSQATLRIVKVFWGLSSALAHTRATSRQSTGLQSYSLYLDRLADWYDRERRAPIGTQTGRTATMNILQEES